MSQSPRAQAFGSVCTTAEGIQSHCASLRLHFSQLTDPYNLAQGSVKHESQPFLFHRLDVTNWNYCISAITAANWEHTGDSCGGLPSDVAFMSHPFSRPLIFKTTFTC